MQPRPHVPLGLILILALALGACSDDKTGVGGAAGNAPAATPPSAPPPTPVRASLVTEESVADHRLASGSLRAESTSAVSSQVSGQVTDVFVREGQTVGKGEALATIDTRRIDAQIISASARIKVAQANRAVFQAELSGKRADLEAYERANARKPGAISDMTMREASTQIATLEARVSLTDAEVESLEAQLEEFDIQKRDARIVAPFDAIVIRRYAEPGQWVTAGTEVATLSSIGFLEAVLDVEEGVPMEVLSNLGEFTIRVPALNLSVKTHSHRIVREVDHRARRFRVVAKVFQVGGIAPGMSISAWLPTSTLAPRMVIPSDALLKDAVGYFAMKAMPAGPSAFIAMPARVNLEFSLENGHSVISPMGNQSLSVGDLVVSEGNIRLFPMTSLKLTNLNQLVPAAVQSAGSTDQSDASASANRAAPSSSPSSSPSSTTTGE